MHVQAVDLREAAVDGRVLCRGREAKHEGREAEHRGDDMSGGRHECSWMKVALIESDPAALYNPVLSNAAFGYAEP
jgi:hypothetical protein